MSLFTQLTPGTYQEIRTLHTKAKAVPGKIYYGKGKDGSIVKYEGTHEGRLREAETLTNTVDNVSTNTTDISNIKETLEDHETRITTLEDTKADKCYALAMSIIL